MTYVAQTGCTLQVRMKEHMQAFTNSDAMDSALADRAINNQSQNCFGRGRSPAWLQINICINVALSKPAYPLTTSTNKWRSQSFSHCRGLRQTDQSMFFVFISMSSVLLFVIMPPSIAHFWYWFVYKWSLSAHFVKTH